MTTVTMTTHPRRTLRALVTVVLTIALFGAGVAAFGPTFSGLPGWIAAGGGVLVGALVAALAARFRWGLLLTAAAALVAYLLFGAALAIPRTAIAGVLPSLDSLQRLALLLVQSWRDLLTVTTPADRFTGPAVVPYLAGLILAVIATSIALRTRRPLWALAPAIALLVIALAWGTSTPFAPGWLVAGLLAAAVAYAAWHRHLVRATGAGELVAPGYRRAVLPVVAAAVALALLGASAVVAAPALSTEQRHVLRDLVDPPLDLKAYASPLTSYRYWEVDQKEETLFTVTGLPEDARLRIATLDTFDGNVYNVAQESASYVRAGDRIDGEAIGTRVDLEIGVEDYTGIWLPGAGAWRGIEFAGPQANAQADSLYHSTSTSGALTTAGIAPGDRFRMVGDLTTEPDRRTLADARPAAARLPRSKEVPAVVSELAEEYAGDAETPFEQLTRLEARLQEGFYSDGSDGKSRAGHTAERIATMLSAPQLIGDDEQYAVAMALMARELGHPARVVMGFYPDPKAPAPTGTWQVRGTEAHVWVEVDFGARGWVTFDPTPDRDRIPNTEVPQPQPRPKPQVPPPPQPPPPDADDEAEFLASDQPADKQIDLSWLFAVLRIVGTVVAIAAVVAAPFLLILLAKRRRRSRRRTAANPADRISGAWEEVVDSVIDFGTPPPRNATRREEAMALTVAYPELTALPAAARHVDTQVYGPDTPDDEAVERAWTDATALVDELHRTRPPMKRFIGFCSLRSFWRGRGVPRRRPGASAATPREEVSV